ncbi:MAG: phage holin family protein [Opitutaceae bacterium]|jgi:uncharacterized membrane protein YqjE|nr:phage holin family protein [Opitutaceae bacterium]
MPSASSIFSGVTRIPSSAAAMLRGLDHRAELATLELGEAREHATGIAALFLISAVAALLTGFAVNLFIAALWWDTPHRLLAVGAAIAVQGALAAGAAGACLRRARSWRPLPETIDQFKKDSQCLHELLTPPPR